MIHPDMATMLGFLTTDAPVEGTLLQSLLAQVVEDSFNMITIDGDTSPEDMVVLLANGAAAPNGDAIDAGHPALPPLRAAVEHVAVTLSRKLARDGEGAGKLLEVHVDFAASAKDARLAAKAVAGSLLVKTAVYGNDPNWGRVLVAAGYSGAQIEERRTSLSIQEVEVYRRGEALAFDPAALSAALAHPEVRFRLDLGLGEGSATAWGCDLTPEYVRINSEYTT
jgi:glutamate N-acetyltransferase/amino-acid N-acetyltransferase